MLFVFFIGLSNLQSEKLVWAFYRARNISPKPHNTEQDGVGYGLQCTPSRFLNLGQRVSHTWMIHWTSEACPCLGTT